MSPLLSNYFTTRHTQRPKALIDLNSTRLLRDIIDTMFKGFSSYGKRLMESHNPAKAERQDIRPIYLTYFITFYRRPACQCRAAACLVDVWWFRQRPKQATVHRSLRKRPSQPERLPDRGYVLRLSRVDRLWPGPKPVRGWTRDCLAHHLVSPSFSKKKKAKQTKLPGLGNISYSWFPLLLLLLLTTHY